MAPHDRAGAPLNRPEGEMKSIALFVSLDVEPVG
jgi:hypothetical protein